MKDETQTAPQASQITDPTAAQLSQSGHWGETQVIESIKEATFRRRDPRRALMGEMTQPLGGVFHPTSWPQGTQINPRPSFRTRIRRILGYLTS